MAYENSKIPYKYGELNASGIPLFDPESIGEKGNLSYHPISIVQYGLGYFNRFVNLGDEKDKEVFLNCATFLAFNYAENIKTKQATWFYNFPIKFPACQEPWFSGMCQGQILSLFPRAYTLTGDQIFKTISDKALLAFKYEISEGGCIYRDDKGVFIQELAFSPITNILNGAMYAIIGILEYYQTFRTLKEFPEELIEGLIIRLDRFDTGYWSRYSENIRFNLADAHYHQVHIKQLMFLGESLGSEKLLYYGERFRNYQAKHQKWIKYLRFLSLNVNRLFRISGFAKYLFKSNSGK